MFTDSYITWFRTNVIGEKLILNWQEIFTINEVSNVELNSGYSNDLNAVLQNFKEVFNEEIGTLKDTFVHIELKKSATPHFYKPCPVPYAHKNRIENELLLGNARSFTTSGIFIMSSTHCSGAKRRREHSYFAVTIK